MYLVQEDIEADFRVLLGIWDPWALPAQEFIDTASRLVNYKGTMRAEAEARANRIHREKHPEMYEEDSDTTPAPGHGASRDGKRRTVKATSANLRADPILSQFIEVKGGKDAGERVQAP